jgi:hypothetical protein
LGLSVYLAGVGWWPPGLVALSLATVRVKARDSYALAWPLCAALLALLLRMALQTPPLLGWTLVLGLVGLRLARRRRLREEHLPLLSDAPCG